MILSIKTTAHVVLVGQVACQNEPVSAEWIIFYDPPGSNTEDISLSGRPDTELILLPEIIQWNQLGVTSKISGVTAQPK